MSGAFRRAGWSVALCAALVLAITGAALAQGVSAKAFVEAIYKPYLKKSFRGIEYSRPANLRRYFEPVLADAIMADMQAAKMRGEVPMLDGDPFLDAQDWEIGNLAISVKSAGTGRASATVTFTNMREPKTITLDLVNGAGGWRIVDIVAPSGSLRKLYKLN